MEKPQEPPPPVDERVVREILTRRGQSGFRSALLRAYGCRCAISTCADVDVLEAAHIIPHSDTQDYRTANGLLLRADLHTLFDLRLISIDPRTAKVVVSRGLGDTYQPLNGSVINLPVDSACHPDPSLLMHHFNQWQANEQSNG
ncbi:HNH endonuclease [Pseudomonas sp. AL-54]|nr:HNH endonuclease [Pseudomonas lopnurensis]